VTKILPKMHFYEMTR